MIFVTLGSQKFQFNRLLKKIDEMIAEGAVTDEVFAQIGYSDYKPQNYGYKEFMDRNEFSAWEGKADLVITHGGTGAIIGAVKKGKKVIAIPRLSSYGEHVDDHQLQIIKEFDDMGILTACIDVETLGKAISEAVNMNFREYHSSTYEIVKDIDGYLMETYYGIK